MKFKTISPYFERERDGFKCNTVRTVGVDDSRYVKLYNILEKEEPNETIEIVNPETGEIFERWITDVCFFDGRWIISWKDIRDSDDRSNK